MKLTALTRENGEVIKGDAVEIAGGLPKLFAYLAGEVDWKNFLVGFRRPGIERQYFRTVAEGVSVTVIIGPAEEGRQVKKPTAPIGRQAG